MTLGAVVLLLALGRPQGDLEIAPIYGAWTATGSAFRLGPASGGLLPKLEIVNARSDAVISSEIEGDRPTGTLTSPPFRIERRYVSFLIGGGDEEGATCLELLLDGKVVRSATGRRSDRLRAESWDVGRWRGNSARLRVVDEATGDWGHVNVDRLLQTDHPEKSPMADEPLYRERLRPQFHFTARQWTIHRAEPGQRQEGWINDLNGLVFFDGEYHLFAQRWAKCWLHAVSRDLVHWTELPPAFWEESEGSGVQSGTCVVDHANTSGLGKDAMVAFWSRFDNRSQCISFSLDHGRTWTRYAGNPIFEKAERDPQVFWYEPGKHWVMVMYGEGAYHILTSPDLLHWTDERHPIPDSFECPDLFELPLDGDLTRTKWVLIQGNGNYSVGSFDGQAFHQEVGRFPCDLGPNFYATQSWHDLPHGRRVQAAWMRGPAFPDMPFNQQVSFPCELTLRTTPDGPRLYRQPIGEIAALESKPRTWAARALADGGTLSLAAKGDLYRIKAELEIAEGARLVFSLRGESVVLTAKDLTSGAAHGTVRDRVRSVEILLDRASIETFVNGGELSSTRTVFPQAEGLSVREEGGAVVLRALSVTPLRSAWTGRGR